jgi:hypothetical protein
VTGSQRSVRGALAVHRALRRLLLPRAFRARSEREIVATFEEAALSAGPVALLRLLAREAADLALAGVRVRRAARASTPTETRRSTPMSNALADVMHAVRMGRKAPAFSVLAIVTLALGVGAATAIWTLADGVLFRPLPHARPDRLVMVSGTSADLAAARLPVSYPNYRDLRAAPNTGVSDLAAFTGGGTPTVVIDDAPEAIRAARATPNLFALLGNRAIAGRTLTPADEEGGAIVVLSEALWRARFGSDPAIVGGDDKVAEISAASIIAKTTRDRIMREIDQLYPGYEFARHKGYGTAAHQLHLRRLGPCEHHRRSFAPVRMAL